MSLPAPDRIFAAIDATWPPARILAEGPWRLREGLGGGQRVSAATAADMVGDDDIPRAEVGMRGLNQHPLFMIRPGDDVLDRLLASRSYDVVDPVRAYIAATDDIAATVPPSMATPSWPLLSAQREIWAAAGIGPGRIAVMERAGVPKTAILARSGDAPAGVAFIALDGDIAMLHALEVTPGARRRGLGTRIVQASARWAAARGARWFAVLVTRANLAANDFYRRLGMSATTSYHYRRAPESPA